LRQKNHDKLLNLYRAKNNVSEWSDIIITVFPWTVVSVS
jgi:hypothetical protein